MGKFRDKQKCKARAKGLFPGDPATLSSAKKICQSNANLWTASDFTSRMAGNGAEYEAETVDTQEAIQKRDKAIKIGSILIIVIVFSVVIIRWIKKK